MISKHLDLRNKLFQIFIIPLLALSQVAFINFDLKKEFELIKSNNFLPACTDSDRDCISDEQEEWFASNYLPIFIFDEEEHNILTNQDPSDFGQGRGVFFLYQVSMVDCSYLTNSDTGEHTPYYASDTNPFGSGFTSPTSVLLTVLEILPYDYLPYDNALSWAEEDDIFVHYGDVETIKICIRDDDRDGYYTTSFIHIRRHKHDIVYRPEDVIWEGSHPTLFSSEGKHGTYLSEDECENAVSGAAWWGWDEDCGGGMKINPASNSLYNVGEYYPGKELAINDIGIGSYFKNVANTIGSNYINEPIWTTTFQDTENRLTFFCGGIDVTEYSGTHKVITGYSDDNCPGGLHNRWWQKGTEYAGTIGTNNSNGSCLEFDTDRYGSDYNHFEMINSDPHECTAACVADANCVSYTFVPLGVQAAKAECYLKNSAPAQSPIVGYVSGLRSECLNSSANTGSNPIGTTVTGACWELDTDRPGSDYKYFEMPNPDSHECTGECVADTNCVSYTYVPPGFQAANALCYLKSSAPAPNHVVGLVSGLRSECLK